MTELPTKSTGISTRSDNAAMTGDHRVVLVPEHRRLYEVISFILIQVMEPRFPAPARIQPGQGERPIGYSEMANCTTHTLRSLSLMDRSDDSLTEMIARTIIQIGTTQCDPR